MILLSTLAYAQPVVLDYETTTFCSTAGLAMVSSGYTPTVQGAGPCRLWLTDDSSGVEGAVWATTPLPLSATTGFDARFHLTIDEGDDDSGRTGGGFVLHADPSGTSTIGSGSSGLGIRGISPSVAVEIDTNQGSGDPSNNHLGLDLNGDVTSIATATTGFDFNDTPGGFWVWVVYRQATQQLDVYTDPGPTRPASPELSVPVDLLGTVGSSAWVGFVMATGNEDQNEHKLDSWFLELDEDGDGDGVLDLHDLCAGDDATGDTDGDDVCDDLDLCQGDDALGDPDGDGICGTPAPTGDTSGEPTVPADTADTGSPSAGEDPVVRLPPEHAPVASSGCSCTTPGAPEPPALLLFLGALLSARARDGRAGRAPSRASGTAAPGPTAPPRPSPRTGSAPAPAPRASRPRGPGSGSPRARCRD